MCPSECIRRIRQALEIPVVVENVSVSRLTLDMLYDWFDVQQARQTELCIGFIPNQVAVSAKGVYADSKVKRPQ